MLPKRECVVDPNSRWSVSHARRACDLSNLYDFEANSYCVIHLPDDQNGKTTDFKRVVKEKLEKQENFFDFAYFPDKFELERAHCFETPASFAHALFKKNAYFPSAEFKQEAFFMEAIFEGQLDLSFAKFESNVWFGRGEFQNVASFRFAKFRGMSIFDNCAFLASVDFSGCQFNGHASFQGISSLESKNRNVNRRFTPISKATFSQAHFNEVIFQSAKFENIELFYSIFRENAIFAWVEIQKFGDFSKAQFEKTVDFANVVLSPNAKLRFTQTLFRDYVYFDNRSFIEVCEFTESNLDFQDAVIEKPERFRFHTVVLRPHWFVNVDSRKLDFTNVRWLNNNGSAEDVRNELKELSHEANALGLLTVTFRQLAENYENNNRFEQASRFRRAALETLRLRRKEFQLWWLREEFLVPEFFKNLGLKFRQAPFDLAHFLYRVTSYYGESSIRALFWLISIVIVAALLYSSPLSQFKESSGLAFVEAIFYSARVMILQRPDPSPSNLFAKGIVATESVIAPIQLALLALALRRKFMR
jgi:uncharacterized protein YjbI with pentapeptide repeats